MTAVLLRGAIVALALATAGIHASLGSPLFLANAAGYTVLALAMVAPIAFIAERRWLVRLALLGFTAATITGWVMFGARFWLAYVDKAIELALISLIVVEMFHYDGGPANALRRGVDGAIALVRAPFARRRAA